MTEEKDLWLRALADLQETLERVVNLRRRIAPEAGKEPAAPFPEFPWEAGKAIRADDVGRFMIAVMRVIMDEIQAITRSGRIVAGDDKLDLLDCMDRAQKSFSALPAEGEE